MKHTNNTKNSNYKQNNIIFLLIVLLIVFYYMNITGCSDSRTLDRESAMELLIEKNGYPKEITDKIITSETLKPYSFEQRKKYLDILTKTLVHYDLGKLTISGPTEVIKKTNSPIGNKVYTTTYKVYKYNVALNAKGKDYIRGEETISNRGTTTIKAAIGTWEIVRVSGIRFADESKSKALVDYQLTFKNNDLGRAFNKNFGRKDGTIINKSTYFALYDDGWRIAK